MIAIVDYGAGNLRSVQNALIHLGAGVVTASRPDHLEGVEKIILPGVGAFGAGMKALRDQGFIDPIKAAVQSGVLLFGICLGLQYLFESSDEMGLHEGLGLLPGRVTRFPADGLRVPHIGWNSLIAQREHPLLTGLPDEPYAYFVHSYYAIAADDGDVIARTDYGLPFVSMAARGNVSGIQCHPEKSQGVGLRILKNFIEMKAGA